MPAAPAALRAMFEKRHTSFSHQGSTDIRFSLHDGELTHRDPIRASDVGLTPLLNRLERCETYTKRYIASSEKYGKLKLTRAQFAEGHLEEKSRSSHGQIKPQSESFGRGWFITIAPKSASNTRRKTYD
jgi:hypothetical protein